MLFQPQKRISGSTVAAVWVVGLITVVISSAIAWDGDVPEWERQGLLFFNGWPDELFPIFWFLQQFGVTLSPVIAGAIVFYKTRNWWHLTAISAILPLKLLLEKGIVKQLVERERPFTSIGPEINVRGPAFDGLSFPSGHTTTAVALGVLLVAFVPDRWKPVTLFMGFITAISRLYFGEHNILDVVAGTALGTMFAVALWFTMVNRLVKDSADQPSAVAS